MVLVVIIQNWNTKNIYMEMAKEVGIDVPKLIINSWKFSTLPHKKI